MAVLMILKFAIVVSLVPAVRAEDLNPSDISTDTPSSVSHFYYFGCITSGIFTDAEVSSFTQVEEWEFMNINQCVSDCYHAAFAAVHNQCVYYPHSAQAYHELTSLTGHVTARPIPMHLPTWKPARTQTATLPAQGTLGKYAAVPATPAKSMSDRLSSF